MFDRFQIEKFTPGTMALRRPPTRVELKADDIKEYEQYKNESLMAESDSTFNNTRDGHLPQRARRIYVNVRPKPTSNRAAAGRGGTTTSTATAAERIGVTRR